MFIFYELILYFFHSSICIEFELLTIRFKNHINMTIQFKIYAFVNSLTSLVTRTYFLNILTLLLLNQIICQKTHTLK